MDKVTSQSVNKVNLEMDDIELIRSLRFKIREIRSLEKNLSDANDNLKSLFSALEKSTKAIGHKPCALSSDTSVEEMRSHIASVQDHLRTLQTILTQQTERKSAEEHVNSLNKELEYKKLVVSNIQGTCLEIFGSEEHLHHISHLLHILRKREQSEIRLAELEKNLSHEKEYAQSQINSAKDDLRKLELNESICGWNEKIAADRVLTKIYKKEEELKKMEIKLCPMIDDIKKSIKDLSEMVQKMNEKTIELFILSPEVAEYLACPIK
jgi:hypothetical protein